MNRFVVAGALAGLLTAPAEAAVSTFTDLAGWQAAVGSSILEDFSGSPPGVMSPGSTDIGAFSIFLDKNGQDRNAIDAERYRGYIDDPTQSIDVGALVLRFDFDAPITAFAGDWASMTNADKVTVTLAGSTIEFDDFLTTGTGTGFLGFVSDTPFSSMLFGLEIVTLAVDGEAFTLDNARLSGGGTAVPEPSTLALLGLGVLGMAGRRRRGA